MAVQEHDVDLSCNKNGRFTSPYMSMKYTKKEMCFPTHWQLEASVVYQVKEHVAIYISLLCTVYTDFPKTPENNFFKLVA